MSDAYKCDRCGELETGRPSNFDENHGWGDMEFDLCDRCKENLKAGLRNGV